MSSPIQFGIRINVDGNKESVERVEQVKAATAGLGKTAEATGQQIAAANQMTISSTAQLAASQAKASEGFKQADTQIKNVGMSAKQTAAALRGIPAQMTDIFTSLASGQAPMTVLLQQGGQLKDMFDGIGPAIKAVGGYIAGLISPFTIAVALVGALAVAYNQGSKEADEYTRAIVLSGNAAGTTSNRLAEMAGNISKNIGTQAKAAEALVEMARTGEVAAGNLEYFSRVAVQMEKTVGQSVADTAKDLAELGKSPVTAAEKLNESYRFLTATVYEQIKALQEQGRTEEAAAVAQKAYIAAFEDRSKKIQENLGYIESAYRSTVDTIKGWWDAVLGVGRKATLADQLSEVRSQIEEAEKNFDRVGLRLRSSARANIDALKQREASLQEMQRLEQRGAEIAAAQAKQEAARINWLKEGDKYLDKRAQMEREVNKAVTEGVAAGMNAVEVVERIEKIREKYAEKKTGSAGVGNTELANLRARVAAEQQYLEQLKEHGTAADKVNEGERLALQYSKQLEGAIDAKTRARLGELQTLAKSLAVVLNEQQAYKDSAKAREETAKAAEKMIETGAKEVKSLEEQISKQVEHNAAIGLSKVEVADLAARKLELAAASDEELAANLRNAAQYAGPLHDAYLQYAADLETAAKLKRELAQEKRTGAIKEVAVDEAKKASEEWQKTAETIERSLTDALMRGFESGKGWARNFRDTLVNMFKTLVLRPIISAVMAPISGAITSAIGSATGNLLGNAATSATGSVIGSSIGGLGGAMTIASNIGGGAAAGFAQLTAGVNPLSALSSAMDVAANSVSTAIGQVMGYLGPILLAIGVLVKGLSYKTVGSGILGSVEGDDFTGSAYQFKKSKFRGSKTVTSTLDPESDRAFSAAVESMAATFNKLGEVTGAGANILQNFNYSFRLALADLDEEGKKKEIQRFFSAMSDSMAMAFVDTFRTTVDTAAQAASRYWTNTIDGEAARPNGASRYWANILGGEADRLGDPSNIITQERVSTPLDPYIDDMIRLFDAQRDSLEGVAGAEGKLAQFTEQLFTLGNQLAANAGYAKVFGTAIDFKVLESVAEDGETAVDTFNRLNSVFGATNAVAATLGKNVETAFGVIGVASTEARQRLIDLAGGIESVAGKTSYFAQAFLTEAEQLAPVIKSVRDRMTELGYANVDTKEEFKDLVRGLDLSTAAGATLYAQLLDLAPAFATVADYQKRIADEAIANAKREAEETVRVRQAAAEKAARLQQAAAEEAARLQQAAAEQARAAVENARNAVAEAYNRESDALKSTIETFEDFAKSLRSFRDSLLTGALSPQSPIQKYLEAKKRFDRTYSLAKSGDPAAMENLQGVAEQFLQASQAVNASSEAYTADFEIVRNAIDMTADAADMQVEIARSELALLDQSVAGILEVNKSVLSLREAISGFRAAEVTANVTSWNNYQISGGHLVGTVNGVQDFNDVSVGNGMYWDSLRGFARVDGSHADGLDFVPFNGYRAELHEREMVLTASEADAYRSGRNNKEVAAAIDRQSAAIQHQADAVERLAVAVESNQVASKEDMRNMLQHMSHVVSKAVAA